VHNLLTNAVRYSPETGGKVVLVLAQNKQGIEITVTDNGIGIPKEARKKIFTRFYRADNAVRTVGEGTGLGLYMVKMIMTTTGGKVWFEPAAGGSGTAFHVTIPPKGMTVKKGAK
jgi:signal transduction histidine kinase